MAKRARPAQGRNSTKKITKIRVSVRKDGVNRIGGANNNRAHGGIRP